MSYRSADIYVHETKAGVLEEIETGSKHSTKLDRKAGHLHTNH
jgi:hypothetical protein